MRSVYGNLFDPRQRIEWPASAVRCLETFGRVRRIFDEFLDVQFDSYLCSNYECDDNDWTVLNVALRPSYLCFLLY